MRRFANLHLLIFISANLHIKIMFHFQTSRTARVFTLGEASESVKEIWIVLHGYGQLAEYFIKHFEPLDDGSRWIIAPEALSRFYLQPGGGRVGASWMTREDRWVEIEDQLNYLDSLLDYLKEKLPHESCKIHVLGFSQGVATAWRWLMQGKHRADALILWAGRSPREYPDQGMANLKHIKLFAVVGDQDPFASPEKAKEENEILSSKFADFQSFIFSGKHSMDKDTLLHIASVLRN